MGKFYICAPVDEVKLAQRVAPAVERLNGRLPTSDELRERSRESGLDFATMLLYRAIHAVPACQAFIDALDAEAVTTEHTPVAADITTVVKKDGHWRVAALHFSIDLFDNPLLNNAKRMIWVAGAVAFIVGLIVALLLARLLRKKAS